MDTFEKGLEIRREVLGDDYVDTVLAHTDEFLEPVQRLATEWAWGSVWTREGLALRDRSLLEIGILTALGSSTELRTHLVGAIRNGLTPGEIQEALLQTAAHCGFPATVAAFKVAKDVIENFDDHLSPSGSDLGWAKPTDD